MDRLWHIYEDARGVICFDRYFAYLGGVSERLPSVLRSFALDPRRYELRGPATLHDAWMTDFRVSFDHANQASIATCLAVALKLASDGDLLGLRYTGLSSLRCNLIPSRWPTKPTDLLVHEFSVLENGGFRHLVEFDRDVWYEVQFADFDLEGAPGSGRRASR